MAETKAPDPELHKSISLAKSVVRIAAGVLLVCGGSVFAYAGTALIAAELLGVVEELV